VSCPYSYELFNPGGIAENIIEDLEVGPQMRALRLHLKDVILKNVYLNYIGKDFKRQFLSKNKYKFFHAGMKLKHSDCPQQKKLVSVFSRTPHQ